MRRNVPAETVARLLDHLRERADDSGHVSRSCSALAARLQVPRSNVYRALQTVLDDGRLVLAVPGTRWAPTTYFVPIPVPDLAPDPVAVDTPEMA